MSKINLNLVVNDVEIVPAYEREDEMLELVVEYTNDIVKKDDEVAEVLQLQHLNDELMDMKIKYGLPDGRMYLAIVDGITAGCVALTRNDDEYCEIKRLYLRPQFRGMGISKALTDKVISDAKDIGYKHIRLDTFPFMEAAIRLYKKYGFYCIERYNDNPAKSAIFMQLDLG